MFFAPLVGLPEPFTALQILSVALIMDGPLAVSLALDGARPGIMNEPPRPRAEPVLPLARVARIFAYGVTMMAGTLAVLYYGLQTGGEDRALTLAFTTFVLFQFFNVFNARSETGSAFNANIFGTTGMAWTDWGMAVGVAASVLLLEEVRKLGVRVLLVLRT